MLDLCCGLGGASRPMRERGWRVIRVDHLGDVKPDVIADVRALPLKPFDLDLLWASPDCSQFTLSRLPFASCIRKAKPIDLSAPLAIRQLIDEWRPRFWVVENVQASRKFLTPIFGPVRAQSRAHYFWSNLPMLIPEIAGAKRVGGKHGARSRREHLRKSVIPYDVAVAIAKLVEGESNGRGR